MARRHSAVPAPRRESDGSSVNSEIRLPRSAPARKPLPSTHTRRVPGICQPSPPCCWSMGKNNQQRRATKRRDRLRRGSTGARGLAELRNAKPGSYRFASDAYGGGRGPPARSVTRNSFATRQIRRSRSRSPSPTGSSGPPFSRAARAQLARLAIRAAAADSRRADVAPLHGDARVALGAWLAAGRSSP